MGRLRFGPRSVEARFRFRLACYLPPMDGRTGRARHQVRGEGGGAGERGWGQPGCRLAVLPVCSQPQGAKGSYYRCDTSTLPPPRCHGTTQVESERCSSALRELNLHFDRRRQPHRTPPTLRLPSFVNSNFSEGVTSAEARRRTTNCTANHTNCPPIHRNEGAK